MKQLLPLLLLTATAVIAAPSPTAFRLGVSYSEWLSTPRIGNCGGVAIDKSGAIYRLINRPDGATAPNSCILMKLSPDGKTIVWQNQVDFIADAMTVDSAGAVYMAIHPPDFQRDVPTYVAKFNADGSGLAWKISVGFRPRQYGAVMIAVDTQGRLFFAGAAGQSSFPSEREGVNVVRVNAAGTALDFTTFLDGIAPESLAVDPSGSAYIYGLDSIDSHGAYVDFLAKVTADGARGYRTTRPYRAFKTVNVDGSGNVIVIASGVIERIDASGAVAVSTAFNGNGGTIDAAGNVYVLTGDGATKNSIATCGFDNTQKPATHSPILKVIAPDGTVLQATYLPGGAGGGMVTAAGTVVMVHAATPSFIPTQSGPFPAGATGDYALTVLSPTAPAGSTNSLACSVGSASLQVDSISPGQLITLFGEGLGPKQGVEAKVAFPNSYPRGMADVKVTVDGTSAPLLWAQDSQINLIAPWSLTPGKNAEICVYYRSVKTNCLSWPVVEATPAVFMIDDHYAAAFNQDGTLNSASNPAAPGSIVSVWATGLGSITPAPLDGATTGSPLPANNLKVEVVAPFAVSFWGADVPLTPFDVQYAGPAPTLVAGISQINFRVIPYPSFGGIYLRIGSTYSRRFDIYVAGQ